MLAWINRLVKAVPAGYQIKLAATKPGERVLGPIPAEAIPLVKARLFAIEKMVDAADAHLRRHIRGQAHGCAAFHALSDKVEQETNILVDMVSVSIRNNYSLSKNDTFTLRAEGVALLESERAPEMLSPGDLLELLALTRMLTTIEGSNRRLRGY